MPLGKRDFGFKKSDESLSLISVAIDGAATESLGYQLSVVEQSKNDFFRVLMIASSLLVS